MSVERRDLVECTGSQSRQLLEQLDRLGNALSLSQEAIRSSREILARLEREDVPRPAEDGAGAGLDARAS